MSETNSSRLAASASPERRLHHQNVSEKFDSIRAPRRGNIKSSAPRLQCTHLREGRAGGGWRGGKDREGRAGSGREERRRVASEMGQEGGKDNGQYTNCQATVVTIFLGTR